MAFSKFRTTKSGREMIAEAIAGGKLTITKLQMGDGEITSQTISALTALISPVYDVPIASMEEKQGTDKEGLTINYAVVKGHFRTSQLANSFYFRELGVFAKIDEGEERLMAYTNAYDLADYIDKNGEETQDRTLAVPVFIGEVKEVYAIINEDLTYVLAEDFEAHTTNKSNPHSVTAEQVGLGNVPNVATNDQTPTYTVASENTALVSGEKLSVAFSKIAKAVSSLISHLVNKNNPHSVTAKQVGLGNVPNVATNDQTPTYTVASENTALVSGEKLSVAFGKMARAVSSLISHLENTSNPHSVTAVQAGALPNTGGNLTGNVLGLNSGKSRVADTGNGIQLYTRNADGTHVRYIAVIDSDEVSEKSKSVRFYDNNMSNSYILFGEHNKPSGSYTGNGSATSRTITTGGTGALLFLWSNNCAALIGNHGAIYWYGTENAYSSNSSVKYTRDGILTISTVSSYFNELNTTYNYQVL